MWAFFNICCFAKWINVKKKRLVELFGEKTATYAQTYLLNFFLSQKIPPSQIRNYQQMVITKKAKQLPNFL